MSYSHIQEKKNEWSNSSEGAKWAEIFDFHFTEEFWKSLHLVNPFTVRGLLIEHEIGEKFITFYHNLLSNWKLIKGFKSYVKKIIQNIIQHSQKSVILFMQQIHWVSKILCIFVKFTSLANFQKQKRIWRTLFINHIV